jgi:hypothetical protein
LAAVAEGARPAKLTPVNLVTRFYWTDDAGDELSAATVDAAWRADGHYRADIIERFDRDHDGRLGDDELRLDRADTAAHIRQNLAALGVSGPRLASEIRAYPIHHDIGGAGWAERSCERCHAEDGAVQRFPLSPYRPAGLTPALPGGEVRPDGDVRWDADGALRLERRGPLTVPPPAAAGTTTEDPT